MTKPKNFNVTTDYATLKNDAKGTMNLVINTGVVIPPGGSYTYETFLDLGTRNAGMRVQMKSSRYGDNWTVGTSMQTKIIDDIAPYGSFDDYFVANVQRVSPTRLRLYLIVVNFSPVNMTIVGGGQTITAEINTFLSPFQ
jgi:hypothetical protein